MVLRTEAPAPGELERRSENIAMNILNLVSGKTVATLQIQDSLQHRLAVNERAVFLHDRLFHDFQRGVFPINRDRLVEHLLQTVWPFEETLWTCETALSQRRGVNSAHPCDPGREALPLRYRFGVHASERDVVDGRNRDRIREFINGESEKSTRARGGRNRKLNGMVEALRHHRDAGCESALDFIGCSQCQHKFLAR